MILKDFANPFYVETFKYPPLDYFIFSVIKMHHLQPKHTVVKQNEAKELQAQFNISASQLPVIKSADKALPSEAKIGDIIKIERKDDKGEKSAYYRIVVL